MYIVLRQRMSWSYKCFGARLPTRGRSRSVSPAPEAAVTSTTFSSIGRWLCRQMEGEWNVPPDAYPACWRACLGKCISIATSSEAMPQEERATWPGDQLRVRSGTALPRPARQSCARPAQEAPADAHGVLSLDLRSTTEQLNSAVCFGGVQELGKGYGNSCRT